MSVRKSFFSSRTRFSFSSSVIALLATGAVIAPTGAFALDSGALPQNGTVVGGDASFDYSTPNRLDIQQNTDRAIINWDSFNIGTAATTEFHQLNSGSLAVNHVYSKGLDPTQILGTLKANGQVIVLDRNGVIFGRDAVINVGGIIASTGDVSNAQVMGGAGKIDISNLGDGDIVNNGVINADEAGLVGFVGKTAVNNGVINAKLGRVALVSGEKATVDLYGDGLIEIAANSNLEKAIVKNSGTINAEGGTVKLTAAAAKSAVDDIVNMNGVVNVSSVHVQGGKIILSAGHGTATVSGKLDASGTTGGSVAVTGNNVQVTDSAKISADGVTGKGGSAYIYGDNAALFDGTLSAHGASLGGAAEISGGNAVGFNGLVDLGADDGANGTLVIDPKTLNISNAATSGILADIFSGGTGTVNVNAQSIANTLRLSNVNLWATQDLNVTSNIDLSTWNGLGGTHGITSNDLTLAAPTLNLSHDMVLGSGKLNLNSLAGGSTVAFGLLGVPSAGVNVDTVNLNGKISTRSSVGGTTSLAGDAQLDSQANTVNVQSNAASVQQGLYLVKNSGGTVNLGDGTYTENVVIDKKVKLQSVNGAASTTLNGISNVGALGTVTVANGVNGAQIGDTNKGITVNGVDNGLAAIENAAVYIQGAHDGLTLRGNTIVAQGDEALVTEYGLDNANLTIDGNIFSGNTFVGAVPAVGDQFADDNVARQLVALNFGLSKLVFTNNSVTGNSGDQHLVAIESNGAIVTGNGFDGTTTFAALRVAGSDIGVSGNTVDGNGSGIGIYGRDTDGLTISGNTVDNTGANGIQVSASDGAIVTGNFVGTNGGANNIGADGLHIVSSNGVDVSGNTVYNAKGYGIYLTGGTDNVVGKLFAGNTVDTVALDGIKIDGEDGDTVAYNNVSNAGRVGIYGGNATHLTIKNNDVDSSTFAIGSPYGAITTDWGSDIAISDNTVENSTQGVRIYLAGGTNKITGNIIHDLSDDGIWVDGTNNVEISGNYIGFEKISIFFPPFFPLLAVEGPGFPPFFPFPFDIKISAGPQNVKGNGVTIVDSSGAQIRNNNITDTRIGVFVDPSPGTIVTGNTIDNTSGDGVYILNSDNSTVSSNFIGTTGAAQNIKGNGIHFAGSNGAIVQSNTIRNTQKGVEDKGSGVFITGGTDALVGGLLTGNTIDTVGWDGVKLVKTTGARVTDNTISNTARIGIYTVSTTDTLANLNTVSGSTLNGYGGITAMGGTGITFTDNNVSDYVSDGLYVNGASNVRLYDNTIDKVKGAGIRVFNSNDVIIGKETPGNTNKFSNKITNAGYGIFVSGGSKVRIVKNYVEKILNDGITALNLNGTGNSDANTNLIVFRNHVNVGQNGVTIKNSAYARVEGNVIDNQRNVGEQADNSNHIRFLRNSIFDNGGVGLKLTDSDNALLQTNAVYKTGSDAVNISSSDDVNVLKNFVGSSTDGVSKGVKNVKGNGIAVSDSDRVTIQGNTIQQTQSGVQDKGSGVYIVGGTGATVGGTAAGQANSIFNIGWDGVKLVKTTGANIIGNTITNTARVGIFAVNTVNSLFDSNTVSQSTIGTYGGISAMGGNGLTYTNNDVSDYATDGLYANGATNVKMFGNTINNVGNAGIRVFNSNGVTIGQADPLDPSVFSNTITEAAYGIFVSGGGGLTVSDNSVDTVSKDGIYVLNNNGATINANDVTGATRNGFSFTNTDDLTVTGNTSDGSDASGMLVADSNGVTLDLNTIIGSGINGLYVSGPTNGSVVLTGNTFTDNDVGARFESGDIDMTGAANTFTNGSVGMLFSTAPGALAFSMAGDTIGTSVFNGQTQYYVQLAQGAMFDPGTPTILDATNAVFDGFSPSSVGNVLTQAQYDQLENAIYHYNDDGTLGLFFFGAIPVNPAIDQSDIFRDIGGVPGIAGRFSITIRGLPRLPGQTGGGTTNTALASGGATLASNTANRNFSLNDITPAAGGDDETDKKETRRNTRTAAVGTNQAPQDVEPASGGTQEQADNKPVSCWGDAVAAAASGQSVTYGFDGGGSDALAIGGCSNR